MVRQLRNQIDFFLRNHFKWHRPLPQDEPIHPRALTLKDELKEFLLLFNWEQSKARDLLRVGDVGTRTFVSALAIEEVFAREVQRVSIHGFEIDPYRRFTNWRTRADYGNYYAKKVSDGSYHAYDFLQWSGELDVLLMLHPFVTLEPLLAWGLPKTKFQPELLFEGAARTLRRAQPVKSGVMLLSSPTEDEFCKAKNYALNAGFEILEEKNWIPNKTDSIQKQPRLGVLLQASN